MAKIIQFPSTQSPAMWMEELSELIQDDSPVAIAIKLPDGSVATGYWRCDAGTRMELIGHLQADVMFNMVKANMDDLVEFI